MSCAACGGDGLIEVGAYRGDDGPETRECRLCGGYPSGAGVIEFKVSESGKRRVETQVEVCHTRENFGPSCYGLELERERRRKGKPQGVITYTPAQSA